MNKKNKYPIHEDFKNWSKFNPPLNKFILFFEQKLLNLFYYSQKSDKTCNVDRLKISYNNEEMRALVYYPKNLEENAPCLIYYHGGGFVLPAYNSHYNHMRKYAVRAKCKVIFVDYPLAPKHKYPTAINACFDAYKWVLDNSEELKIDKNHIAVGGDSAGGNIASVVCMLAHDKKVPMPCGQMLIYPAIGSEIITKSMEEFTDTPMCNSKDYEKYLQYYFASEQDKLDKYVSPIRAKSFDIYPSTYIETAEFDCLRDEGVMFADNLKNAGVETTLNNTKGTMHGYDIVIDSKITVNNVNKRIKFLKGIFNK